MNGFVSRRWNLPVDKHLKDRKSVGLFNGDAEKAVAGLEERLNNLRGLARASGESLANAGRQAEAAMQGVGKQADGVGEKLAKAFGPKPVEAGVAAISGGMQTLKAQSELNDAVLSGRAESILLAQDNAAAQRSSRWFSAINRGGTGASPVQIPAEGGWATQRFAGGGSVQHSALPVHVTANITVNPPPGANPRDIARAVVDELARLKIRGRG
jgi:acetylornithine deacetylase/succinyl-diaminopimelate desuccinylase-like protein